MTLKLIINGESKQIEAGNVRELLVAMGLEKQAVAVEVNREVIPKRLHDQTPLKDGDTIELVTLVGGG
jgi:thiamine biosynthesis protein ThiS